MIRCGFEQGAALMGCTSVQNIFILEYMPKAPELYCKVYLFGLMQCGCRRLENADLCASLGIDSAKAVEAFLYWQDMGLLRIVEQEPLSVEYLSVQAGPVTGGTRKYAPLVSALRQVCGARVLTPGELSKIYDWIEVFGLEEAAAVMLVRRCMELKGPSVKIQFMDRMAREWAKEGVLTAADAEQRIKLDTELQGGAKAILARWRKGRMATEDELALYKKWTEEWGMTLDEILSACPAMTSSDKPTFAYLNAILEGMRMEGGVQEAIKSAALTGEITDPRDLGLDALHVDLPDHFLIDDSAVLAPAAPEDAAQLEVLRGPNIKEFPQGKPVGDTITAKLTLKVGDNITTDHIMPAGSKILPYRSNIPKLSEFCFAVCDKEFAKNAKAAGETILVGGSNYGQGSSREHAALVPLYLGIRAVIAKSFARIHAANLINAGILPLTFAAPDDYDALTQGETLTLTGIDAGLDSGTMTLHAGNREIPVCGSFTKRQAAMLRAGGLLNYTKEGND